MPDHRYSAFHEPGHSLTVPYALDGVIEIDEIQFPTMVLLSGRDAEASLPTVNRMRAVRLGCVIYGLAPDRWLVAYSAATGDRAEFTSSTVFATDHSDAWAALRLRGHKVADVLQCLCSVDIHPASFGYGVCFQSRLGGNPALVCRSMGTESLGSFDILTPRSSARGMLEDIHDAAIRI